MNYKIVDNTVMRLLMAMTPVLLAQVRLSRHLGINHKKVESNNSFHFDECYSFKFSTHLCLMLLLPSSSFFISCEFLWRYLAGNCSAEQIIGWKKNSRWRLNDTLEGSSRGRKEGIKEEKEFIVLFLWPTQKKLLILFHCFQFSC